MPILFYGDTHRNWKPLVEAVLEHRPEHVVLLGDLELDAPIREKAAPVLAAGARLWWVHGNHDTHSEEMWSFLFEVFPDGSLSGRAVRMECRGGALTVAGLGGNFKERAWYPKADGATARWNSPEVFLAQHGRGQRLRGGLPLCHRDTIFPSYCAAMAGLRADVLATHEAPTSVSGGKGFCALDDLAHALGARLAIHGHHHDTYDGVTRDGIPVRGLNGNEVFLLEPGELG